MAVTTKPTLERALAAMLISDRLWLKGVYEPMAALVAVDGIVSVSEIVTVEDFQRIHKSVKRFAVSGMHCNDYPGLVEAIDREIDDALCDATDGIISGEDRVRLVAALDKIAWHGLGGDG